MLEVRWYLDAFLKYTRKQLMDSSKGLSPIIINNDIFNTLPDTRSSSFDPRTIKQEPIDKHLSMPDESDMRAKMKPSFYLHFGVK